MLKTTPTIHESHEQLPIWLAALIANRCEAINHTSHFWSIVRAKTPAMEKAKAWLKEHGQILEEEV
jgi:hypothetical protein